MTSGIENIIINILNSLEVRGIKKIMCIAAVAMISLCAGCKKENKENREISEFSEQTSAVTQATEQRVLAIAGEPNEDGYYSIDLPRSANDLVPLEQINDRLYWASVVMAQENIQEFNENVPPSFLWKTLHMEISFNYGNTKPFKEGSDESYTEIGVEDFYSFAKQCFKIEKSLLKDNMPGSFKETDNVLHIEYGEPEQNAFGFVMNEYKQDGQTWYVKGEIMSSGGNSFVKGEFILEENSKDDMVTYKLVSFSKE